MQVNPRPKASEFVGLAVFIVMSAILLAIGNSHRLKVHDSCNHRFAGMNGLDVQISEYLYPSKPKPGLQGDVTALMDERPLVARVLNLPEDSDIYAVRDVIQKRLEQAKKQSLSAHDEACAILELSPSCNEHMVFLRLEFEYPNLLKAAGFLGE